jgi:hypothetical protein
MILSISGSYEKKGFIVFRPKDRSCWIVKEKGRPWTRTFSTRKEANDWIDARHAHAAARQAQAQEAT